MSTLRFGVISTARIATTKVIPAMAAATNCEVVAIASRDAAAAEEAAQQLGIARAHDRYEAILEDEDVDAVYIPLPNHLHAEWAVAAAEAGKHILCEKPLALTADDAQAMVDTAERAGVRFMEAFMYRLHPVWERARELVADGRIGRLHAIDSWFSYYNDDPDNIRNIASAGGGALMDIGCYAINLSRMLFGDEPTEVSSTMVRDPQAGVDTTTSAILRFEAGVASFTCSSRLKADQHVTIYGDAGRLRIPVPFNLPPDRPSTLEVATGAGLPHHSEVEVEEFAPLSPYTAQAERFAAAVLDGSDVPIAPTDGVANMRVLERVAAAAG